MRPEDMDRLVGDAVALCERLYPDDPTTDQLGHCALILELARIAAELKVIANTMPQR